MTEATLAVFVLAAFVNPVPILAWAGQETSRQAPVADDDVRGSLRCGLRDQGARAESSNLGLTGRLVQVVIVHVFLTPKRIPRLLARLET